jgi:guanylate kinase
MGTRIGDKLRPVVFCGPSGTGKSTLIKRLMNEYPNAFAFSVSHTTRKPREGEKDGREYHFVTREQMIKAIENNEFLENAEFSGNMYGTSKKAVEDVLSSGRICALDVDIQGVLSLKKTTLNPIYLFIKPPSMEILEKRLRDRGTETDESIRKRLDTALRELEYEKKGDLFDDVIVNDNLDSAYGKLKEILKPQIILVTNNNQH